MCLQLAGQLGSPSECGRVRCWASPLKIYLSFTTRLSQLWGGLLHFQSNQWTVVGLGGFWLNGTALCVPRYMWPCICGPTNRSYVHISHPIFRMRRQFREQRFDISTASIRHRAPYMVMTSYLNTPYSVFQLASFIALRFGHSCFFWQGCPDPAACSKVCLFAYCSCQPRI